MEPKTLFIGAGLLVVFGLLANYESYVSAGLALMWIGISVLQSERR